MKDRATTDGEHIGAVLRVAALGDPVIAPLVHAGRVAKGPAARSWLAPLPSPMQELVSDRDRVKALMAACVTEGFFAGMHRGSFCVRRRKWNDGRRLELWLQPSIRFGDMAKLMKQNYSAQRVDELHLQRSPFASMVPVVK